MLLHQVPGYLGSWHSAYLCYRSVTGVVNECYRGILRVLQGYHKGVSGVVQELTKASF